MVPAETQIPGASRLFPRSRASCRLKTWHILPKSTLKAGGKKTQQERTFQQKVVDIALAFSLLCITDVSIVREALKQPPLLPLSARGNLRLQHLPPAHQIQLRWAKRREKIAPNCSVAALIPCDQPAKSLIAASARER